MVKMIFYSKEETFLLLILGRIVPEYIFELSLCHELGHSFGSNHDTGMCDGHLMTAHAPKDQQRKHFIFSKCSTSMMLETIINQGQCFENDENPYCGNGKLIKIMERFKI